MKIYKKNKYDGRDRFSFPQSMKKKKKQRFSFELTEEPLIDRLSFYASLRFVKVRADRFVARVYAMILLHVHTLPSLSWVGGNTLCFDLYSSLDWDFFKHSAFLRAEERNIIMLRFIHFLPSRPRYSTFLIIEPSIPSP